MLKDVVVFLLLLTAISVLSVGLVVLGAVLVPPLNPLILVVYLIVAGGALAVCTIKLIDLSFWALNKWEGRR